MKLKSAYFLAIIQLFGFVAFGQSLETNEDELRVHLDELRSATSSSEKNRINDLFKTKLEATLQMNGAFDYPFAELRTLGAIKSPDNAIRIFSWNVENDDFTQKYYCFILSFDDRMKKYKLIELKDNSFMLPPRPSEILESDNWYGALYYKIIPVQKGGRTLYTVLGWDGNNSVSTIKVIDVLSITGSTVKIGSPIFRMGKETVKRVFFEYAKKTTMFLNYEEQFNRIIFDHLAPESPALVGLYSMYVPDLSHDAMKWKDNRWTLVEDVIGVNKTGSETITISVKDEKTGEIKEQKIKNKWEEPSKTHVATTPEDQLREGEETDKQKAPNNAVKTAKGKQPESYNPMSKMKQKKR